MADRKDFYYRQRVLESELDSAFGALETSDYKQVLDLDLGARTPPGDKAEYGGITTGFSITHTSDLDFDITAGSAYDEQGRRTATASTLSITVSNQGDTAIGAAGVPTGAAADPTILYERWVTVYIAYDRLESDLRYDGYNHPVYFERAESFHFNVVAGAEKLIGNLLISDKPARESGKLLLFDVRISNAAGTTTYVSFDVDRREDFLNLTAALTPNYQIEHKGNVRDAVKILLDLINNHAGGHAALHPSSVITTSISGTWADGTGGTYTASGLLSEALNNLLVDLSKKSLVDGAGRIGSRGHDQGFPTPPSSYGDDYAFLASGSVEEHITALLDAVNGRIFRGGDDGIAGPLSPDTDGLALGTLTHSWDVLARDLTVKGDLRSSLTPVDDGLQDIGDGAHQIRDIYALTLTLAQAIAINNGTYSQKLPSNSEAFRITDTIDAEVINLDSTAFLTANEHPLRINHPVLLTPPSATPYQGFDAIRLNAQQTGLSSEFPGLPLAMGTPAAVTTGGMNAYGIPVRGYHFRDNFQYHPSRVTSDTTLPLHYLGEVFATGAVHAGEVEAAGSMVFETINNQLSLASMAAPFSLAMNSTYPRLDWTFDAAFQMQGESAGPTTGSLHIGLYARTTTRSIYFKFALGENGNNWQLVYQNGTSTITVDTGVTGISGGQTKVSIDVSRDSFRAYLFNGVDTFGNDVTEYPINTNGINDFWGPKIALLGCSTLFLSAYLYMWQWYSKSYPFLGRYGSLPLL